MIFHLKIEIVMVVNLLAVLAYTVIH